MCLWCKMFKRKCVTEVKLRQLVEEIVKFDAGAVDKPLTKHAEKALKEWLKEN